MSLLDEINSRLKATDIKGKPYIDVAQRIQGYWEMYPMGRIETEMTLDDGERCVFKATAYDDDGNPIANGHAFETKKGMVNSTSYIENCETSAVGRALGMLGIGSTESIASADEVQNAIEQQEQPKKANSPKNPMDPAEAAKFRAKVALTAWCDATDNDPKAMGEGILKRPEYADTERFWHSVAVEFEKALKEALNG